MPKKQPTLTTVELQERIGTRYQDRGWALIWEVGNATGARCCRHADALAMSVWPSRGIYAMGLELKVSRTDWLKELRSPEKADLLYQYCDYWYVVAGSKDVVRNGELPKTWGLMVPYGKGLAVEIQAPELTPKPWTVDFVASVMRNIAESHVSHREHKEACRKAEDRGYERGKDGGSYELKRAREERKHVEEFEKASGIKVSAGWPHPKELGELVKSLAGMDYGSVLDGYAKVFDKAAFNMRAAKAKLRAKTLEHS